MQQTLAILSGEEEYARLLMEYMNHTDSFPFQVFVFTTVTYLLESSQKIDVLLFTDDISIEQLNEINIPICYCLTEHQQEIVREKWQCIPMFQKATSIIEQLMNYLMKDSLEIKSIHNTKNKSIIGLLSFDGNSNQYLTALSHTRSKNRTGKTLFVSWNPWINVLIKGQDRSSTLSDIIYVMKQEGSHHMQKVKDLIKHGEELDYIVGVEHYSDLMELTEQEVIDICQVLRDITCYEEIIFDIYVGGSAWNHISKQCSILYEISSSGPANGAVIQEFHRQLGLQEQYLLDHMQAYQEEVSTYGCSETGIAKADYSEYRFKQRSM